MLASTVADARAAESALQSYVLEFALGRLAEAATLNPAASKQVAASREDGGTNIASTWLRARSGGCQEVLELGNVASNNVNHRRMRELVNETRG
jgi:hypothetical protein